MLHYDRKTEEYFRAMDANLQSTPAPSEGVRHSLDKIFNSIEHDWDEHFNRIEKGVASFKNKVTSALSHPVPSQYVGKERPVSHKIPYSVSGKLAGSVEALTYRNTSTPVDNTWSITVEIGASHEHADFTNRGVGSKRPDIGWLHWADNIFGASLPAGVLHKAGIPDLRAILLGYYS